MKKFKVLIATRNLIVGGIESAYINFIDYMKNETELDAFLCNNDGALKDKMDGSIKVYEGNKLVRYFNKINNVPISKYSKKNFKSIMRSVFKFIYNKFGIKKFLKAFAILTTKKIKKEYDCAVCFYAQNEMCSKLVLKKVKSKKKFAVIHTDVSKSNLDKKVLKLLEKFDKILCVSSSCAEIFKNRYTNLADQVDYLYNFQNNEKILEKSNNFIVDYPQTFNIVTASRLDDQQKGFLRSLEVFKRLNNDGYIFHWHIVGDGPDRGVIEAYIVKNDMTKYVTLYGNQSNPYPYIKSADIFYLGSYYESWGMVLTEAMLLNVPVLTTKISPVEEVVGNNGFICENNSESIYEKLKYVLDNKKILKTEKEKIVNYRFDNESNKKRFLKMIEDKESE